MRMHLLALLAWPCAHFPGGEGETFRLKDGEVRLEARLEPLTDTVHGLELQHPDVLVGEPLRRTDRYDVDHFRRLLPPRPVEVGEVWPIDTQAVLPFLRQLLPGATGELHHGSVGAPGAFACLRWADDEAAEIVLRAHAEFALEVGLPPTEVWFTPAQFRGRLRLERTSGTLSGFELLLPDAAANVDLNVRVGESVVADIGRIPRMELRTGELPDETRGGLSLAEAEARLARHFYPAAEVEWLPLAAALERAQQEQKLLHVVVMFGSLLDESC